MARPEAQRQERAATRAWVLEQRSDDLGVLLPRCQVHHVHLEQQAGGLLELAGVALQPGHDCLLQPGRLLALHACVGEPTSAYRDSVDWEQAQENVHCQREVHAAAARGGEESGNRAINCTTNCQCVLHIALCLSVYTVLL